MKEAWKSTSNRWSVKDKYSPICEASLNKMEGLMMMYGNEENGMMVKKRVMVVVDNTSYSKHAMMWTLTHVTNKVKVEALVIQGPKLTAVMSQVKKLEVSLLVLGQKKPPSSILSCLCGNSGSNTEEFIEHCINNAECLTIGVRKISQGMNGYLISTRWQKNFWLLA
ncbi:putative rossmann-like alpha/beta/alpha sandwich protein [Lupinus albus]|uniref:Putative rossmann-like alpha/beta/alpha sandwich protein n=1 Tax=Lupinus albus TaxID=3870 RepID=A0A6A4QNZ7_LUPAL|nr:putative rossmann-like alpha/beta/alpha sandwich protein [Lupinus albus]